MAEYGIDVELGDNFGLTGIGVVELYGAVTLYEYYPAILEYVQLHRLVQVLIEYSALEVTRVGFFSFWSCCTLDN
ncbi:MAG: hypothetical protein R3281_00325 [Balneolaceae bacterium]|nr:hypothetical protein [Balneolaceae bacterium]